MGAGPAQRRRPALRGGRAFCSGSKAGAERPRNSPAPQARWQSLRPALQRSGGAGARAKQLSYWDCAIIAAARMLGCRELLSEDLTHGQRIEGMVIRNPFR